MKSYRSSRSAQIIFKVLLGGFVLIPILSVLAVSLRSPTPLHVDSAAAFVERFFSLEQYRDILFHNLDYWICFWNTVLLLVPSMVLTVISASLAAYGLSCWGRSKGQTAIVMGYILLSLPPVQILLVPNFIALSAMGLIGSRLSVVLIVSFSPYYVYFLSRICGQLLPEIFEAARMEGAGELEIYWFIAMPQMKSGIGLLLLIGAADLWNMVEQPLALLQNPSKYPLTLMFRSINSGIQYAGSIIFSLPFVILLFCFGREAAKSLEHI